MGYRIDYTKDGAKRKKISHIPWRKLGTFALVGVAVFSLLWWAKNNTATVSALENMAQQMGNGMSIGDALEAFCIDILQNAEGG